MLPPLAAATVVLIIFVVLARIERSSGWRKDALKLRGKVVPDARRG